jgi:prepilin-type N-terminal cleavage/methylation domain-containing protein
MTNKYMKKTQGFTLVELSIVIIIVGFLIAGISAGTSLIKQAKLSNAISQLSQYQTAFNTFRMKYSAVPGDMMHATDLFPNCADLVGYSWVCNGNGNGVIEFGKDSGAGLFELEPIFASRLLYLAGLINTGGTVSVDSAAGAKIQDPYFPKTSLGSYLYIAGVNQFGDIINGTTPPTGWDKENVLYQLMCENMSYACDSSGKVGINPEDAFSIERKIDDGTVDASGNFTGANTGNLRIANYTNRCATGNNYDINSNTQCVQGLMLADY